ncbi:hypothetical protein [Nocardiopsis alkaliphila]|uniref:hypothetical protein n=1 Tax=Nocardiopsis alkaliphila TaxID=225762 RepID=UPI00034B93BB|nr:hypothetical protein [Nocardiopsis alkaliphila]
MPSPRDGARVPAPTLSATVMTHPARAARAEDLAAKTGLPRSGVALDPDPDGPPTALRSARVAFGSAALHENSHHLVLQDDVRLAEGFATTATRVLAAHPEAAVSLFVEWGSRTAVLARWAVFTGAGAVPVINPYVPTVALALPRKASVELSHFLEETEDLGEPDDRAVLRFVRRTGLRSLVAVPNPVEHEDRPSLVGNDEHGARRSVCFAPRPSGPLSTTVLRPPRALPFLRWNLGTPVLVDLAHDVPEAHRPLVAVLADWGATEENLATALKTHAEGLTEVLPKPHLTNVWHTAVANGAVLESWWPGAVGGLRSRLAEPTVEASLASLVPGALRTFIDLDALAEHRARVVELTLAALEHGAEHCRVPTQELSAEPSTPLDRDPR